MSENSQNTNKSFVCKSCDHIFYPNEEIMLHIMKYHKKENPFICTMCDKKYKCKTALKRYKATYLEKNFFLIFYL